MLRFLNKETFSQSNRIPFIGQKQKGGDGLACIAMLFSYHKTPISPSLLRYQYRHFGKGMGLSDMISIFSTHGFDSRAIHCSLRELADLPLPLILHWDSARFTVLAEITGDDYVILDPASQKLTLPKNQFERHFSEIVLQITDRASPRSNLTSIR